MQDYIRLVVLVLWLLAVGQAVAMLFGGCWFHHYVSKAIRAAGQLRDATGRFKFQPKAAVILPCCGVDEKLAQTVDALSRQDYADYEIIFTFESTQDPAYAAVGEWTAGWDKPSYKRVVAGLAERRSQKIQNLLAAIEQVSDDREVFVFLDSDAIPSPAWLGHLVAPLEDASLGAATGFRWYTAIGGVAAGVRSVWNAITVATMQNERWNFCWGGSTAIRRSTFEKIGVRELWDNSVSDDLSLTLAIRRAKLRIRFVPQSLVPSVEATTLREFWTFARRQLIITRVYMPLSWLGVFVVFLSLVLGEAAVLLSLIAGLLGWLGDADTAFTAVVCGVILLLPMLGRAVLLQLAVSRLLPTSAWSSRDLWWDIAGVVFAAPLHLSLLLSALVSRRFMWRTTEYELVSSEETRILRRIDAAD